MGWEKRRGYGKGKKGGGTRKGEGREGSIPVLLFSDFEACM